MCRKMCQLKIDYRMEFTAVSILLVFLLVSYSTAEENLFPELTEYCEGESFVAECRPDESIIIQQAIYGRMAIGRCIQQTLGVMNCQTNVRYILDELCSGRERCDVRVAFVLESLKVYERPCSNEVRSYLAASFTCVKVITPNIQDCAISNSKLDHITQPSGYISSTVTQQTKCGSFEDPWTIKLNRGLKMTFTLLDFTSSTRKDSQFEGGIPDMCTVYVTIKETISSVRPPNTLSRTICGSARRENMVYTTNGNEVEVRVADKKNSADVKDYFLLQYESFGCAEPARPKDGWFELHKNGQVMFYCNNSDERWSLKCEGDKWVGDNKTCDNIPNIDPGIGQRTDFSGWISGSQWAAIIIIACIAVSIGLVIFMFGLFYIKRKRTLSHHARYGAASTGSAYQRPSVPDFYAQNQSHLYPSMPPPEYTSNRKSYPGGGGGGMGIMPIDGGDIIGMDIGMVGGGGYGSQFTNDYMRTWQLQRHHNASRQDIGVNNTGPGITEDRHSQIDGRPMSEHIYESPNFDRKFNNNGALDNTTVNSSNHIGASLSDGSGGGGGGGVQPQKHKQTVFGGTTQHHNPPHVQTKPYLDLQQGSNRPMTVNNNQVHHSNIMGSSGHTV